MASKTLEVATTAKITDRISNLPDAILCHILTFMPTKYAICTRVLSRRWKYLFSHVPSLDFTCPSRSDLDDLRSFLNLVNWVFNSYKVDQMDKFCYCSCQILSESLPFVSWISDSVRRGVQELDIMYYFSVPQMLPHGVFTCKRLTTLKINSNFKVEIPDDVCLPHVRKIHLSGVSFSDGVSAGRLFRSCPVLENLFLWSCSIGDTRVLEISVPTLKSFWMRHCYDDQFDLVLNAPNVEYFEYIGNETRGFYSVQGLRMLAKANISFHTYSFGLEKIVGAIRHIRHLHICAFSLQAFHISGQPLPLFSNLVHLEIKRMPYSDSRLVQEILDKTPYLQVLVIDDESNTLFRRSPLLPEDVPVCVSLHLKELEIFICEMSEHELKLVEYFLKNAKVLEKLKVRCRYKSNEQVELNKELLALPRYSKACQII